MVSWYSNSTVDEYATSLFAPKASSYTLGLTHQLVHGQAQGARNIYLQKIGLECGVWRYSNHTLIDLANRRNSQNGLSRLE